MTTSTETQGATTTTTVATTTVTTPINQEAPTMKSTMKSNKQARQAIARALRELGMTNQRSAYGDDWNHSTNAPTGEVLRGTDDTGASYTVLARKAVESKRIDAMTAEQKDAREADLISRVRKYKSKYQYDLGELQKDPQIDSWIRNGFNLSSILNNVIVGRLYTGKDVYWLDRECFNQRALKAGLPVHHIVKGKAESRGINHDNTVSGKADKQAIGDWLDGHDNADEILELLSTDIDTDLHEREGRVFFAGLGEDGDMLAAAIHEHDTGIQESTCIQPVDCDDYHDVAMSDGDWFADSRDSWNTTAAFNCLDATRWTAKQQYSQQVANEPIGTRFDVDAYDRHEKRATKARKYSGIEFVLDKAGRVRKTLPDVSGIAKSEAQTKAKNTASKLAQTKARRDKKAASKLERMAKAAAARQARFTS